MTPYRYKDHTIALITLCLLSCLQASCNASEVVTIRVDAQRERKPISGLIYGSNQDIEGFTAWTVMRLSGNRMSTYNWENNASNAGEDGIPPHTNDNWWLKDGLDGYWHAMHGKHPTDATIPAAVLKRFHRETLDRQAYSLIGLQIAGYVAADTDHIVTEEQAAPSDRWARVEVVSPDGTGLLPDPNDGVVYQGQLLHHLIDLFGPASTPGGIRGYALDNEPGLWHKTHPHMHPEPATCNELMDKSIALAAMVKDTDPGAETFGPAVWGMTALARLSDESGWKQINSDGRYHWFIDYYLEQMAEASRERGVRLLDVLDLHWYTEAETIENAGPDGVMQAPRSLYDPTYIEPTWIGKWFSDYLPVLIKAQQSIDAVLPGR